MGLFKKEYDIIELPFRYDNTFDDDSAEALFIDLIFYGTYKEKNIQFNITFQYFNEDNYYEMINYLKQYENRVLIKIKVSAKKVNNFFIDLEDMADKLSNNNILKFDRICWGAVYE